MNLDALPRTICAVRALGDYSILNAKATEATVAFVRSQNVPAGFPVVVMIDQTALPTEERYFCTCDWRVVIDAIKQLVVRGAPAIGIAGAAAVMLRSAEFCYAREDATRETQQDFDRVFVVDDANFSPEIYTAGMKFAAEMIVDARPTAVNLQWGVKRAMNVVSDALAKGQSAQEITDTLYSLVAGMIEEDEAINRKIGENGASLLPAGATILTHCNAGSLATAFYGTALGVVYAAAQRGGINRVYSDETRPVGQGARLTVWELSRAGIPVTLICDNMAASVLASGNVDAVIVGADRVAANGDTANKIGTLGLSIIAKKYNVPFYVACPISTLDLNTKCGEDIVIEERDPSEVLQKPISGVDVYNPAFDVTPAALITAIITEVGVFAPAEISKATESRES